MATNILKKIQDLCRLPISSVCFVGKVFPDIRVETPHKGVVTIELKKTHYPFLFGLVTQTDKSSQEILNEIWKLQDESIDYLLEQWKLTKDR